MQALVLGFCSSGYDFAIPSSRLHLTVQTLGITMWFVGNYAHCGLSPQTDGVPVILIKRKSLLQDWLSLSYKIFTYFCGADISLHCCYSRDYVLDFRSHVLLCGYDRVPYIRDFHHDCAPVLRSCALLRDYGDHS